MTYATVTPATGEHVREFPEHTTTEMEVSLVTAHEAYVRWRRLSHAVRAKIVSRAADIMREGVDDFSQLITVGWAKSIRLEGTSPCILDRQTEMDAIITQQFASLPRYPPCEPPSQLNLIDDELIEQAMTARNGGRFCRLWRGDIAEYDNDHSRADAALCFM